MEFEPKGTGRQGQPDSSQAKRPDQQQAPHQRGEGIRGVPPPQIEQAKPQQERGERQPLPNVWDVLERKVRLHASWSPRFTHEEQEEYWRELREVDGSLIEIKTKGTAREKLLGNLYSSIIVQPGEYGPVIRHLSLEQFQQLRSKVEPLSKEEIREEIHTEAEEKERVIEEARKSGKILTLSPLTTVLFQPNLDHLIDELNREEG